MNKEIYSISGENLEGQEVEVFKAGFNSSNKPVVTVGSNEVSLDDVISTPAGGTAGQVLTKTASAAEWADINALPSGGTTGQVLTKTDTSSAWADIKALPEGGTTGQILTKTATASEWADAPNPVEANPTLAGGETALTSIKIGESKYKIEGGSGGGLPTPADDTDAMIYNGTQWIKQSGYGYTIPESVGYITWDGNEEGKEIVASMYFLISDSIMNSFEDYIGVAVELTDTLEIITSTVTGIFDLTPTVAGLICEDVSDDTPVAIVSLTESSFGGMEFKKGIYFLKRGEEGVFLSKITSIIPEQVKTINSKLIYGNKASAGDAIVYNGTSWATQKNYGYVRPAGERQTLNWNTQKDLAVYSGHPGMGSNTKFYNAFDIVYDTIEEYNNCVIYDVNGMSFKISSGSPIELEPGITALSFGDGEGCIIITNSTNPNYPNGLYVLAHYRQLKYGTASATIPFDDSYFFKQASDGCAYVNINGTWNVSDKYGYYKEGGTKTFTWNGDTTGLDSFYESYYKISSEAPLVKVGDKATYKMNGEEEVEVEIEYNNGMYLLDEVAFISDGSSVGAGIWFAKESPLYVSKIQINTLTNIKKIDEAIISNPLDKITIANRHLISTGSGYRTQVPTDVVSSASITGDGSKTAYYLVHNFNINNIICKCKDSSGAEFSDYTGTVINDTMYKVEFTSAPASGATYTFLLQPGIITETCRIAINEDDTFPVTSEELSELGFEIN